MKRYISYTLILAAGLMLSCTKEKDLGRTPGEPTGIEIEYSHSGEAVNGLSLNSVGQSVVVDVKLNNDNLFWTVESDAEWWCTVVEEKHRGSGAFTLNVAANTEFNDRAPAIITFRCGQYEDATFRVSQSGNVFLLDHTYMVQSKASGNNVIDVTVQKDTDWTFTSDDWLTVSKGTETADDDNDRVTAQLNIGWTENTGESRYGVINLCQAGYEEPESQIYVYQFGAEDYTYDEAGVILLPSEESESFRIKAPSGYFGEMKGLPEWLSYSVTDEGDNVSTYIFTTEDNPSDTQSFRDVNLEIPVHGSDDVKVTIPAMKQDFYTVNGIMTANGLKKFAETVNAGGDVTPWTTEEGKIAVLNNIDMTGLDGEWVSIGTAEHPFTGVFDGQYRQIKNFKSSKPLFGVCSGAVISNIEIDGSSEIKAEKDYISECVAAVLADELTDCTVSRCVNRASVNVSASTGTAGASAYVSGLVAKAKGTTTLSKCENYGDITVTKDAETGGDANFYVAGIVAVAGEEASEETEGGVVIEECLNSGKLSDGAVSLRHYIGGIVALNNGGDITNGTNEGMIVMSSERNSDASKFIYTGGIAGYNKGNIENGLNNGVITSVSDVKMQYIGGIAGGLGDKSKVARNSNGITHAFNIDGTEASGVRQLFLGGLYGIIECEIVLDFSEEKDFKIADIKVKKHENNKASYLHIGGLVGNVYAPYNIDIKAPKAELKFETSAGKDAATQAPAVGIGGIVGVVGIVEKNSGGHLTVSDAVSKGNVSFVTGEKCAQKYTTLGVGGVVGFITVGGATLTNCENEMSFSSPQKQHKDHKSNGCGYYIGGMAGYIGAGNTAISDCRNSGVILNNHYDNHAWEMDSNGAIQKANGCGGILGAFGYKTTGESTITISNCENTAEVESYRGMAGGIAGYVRNGLIDGCTNTGNMGRGERSYPGGIVGIIEKSEVTGCTAKCTVSGKKVGSALGYSGGGIIGLMRSSSCTDNRYYGTVSCGTANAADYLGGLVGLAEETNTVEGCRFGGSLVKVDAETPVNSGNVNDCAVGHGLTVTDCQYWDGN